ncbi:MAG: DUF3095 domain-containing protein [Cyanobacteriota bacterium]|nr:DUF3095 domain-containing protein [Cyanobacteriota bacterium]
MSTEYFYQDLPSFSQFCSVTTDADKFVSVPDDWCIVITDVAGSTKAIEAGRYKDVNILGACSIIAVLNIAGNLKIPFIFGGDGASLLVPPSLLAKTREVLLATQHLACQEFDLYLRVGVVPVSTVTAANYEVKIAKVNISKKYQQAMFSGGGLAYAEELIKNPATGEIYNLTNPENLVDADFSGLICPWQNVASKEGLMLSLIVKATCSSDATNNLIYVEFGEYLSNNYKNENLMNPIAAEKLKITLRNEDLYSVVKVHSRFRGWWQKMLLLWQTKITNFMFIWFMKFKVKLGEQDFGKSKLNVVADTDFRKFDDALRMVIPADETQIEKLENYLEAQYQKGKLVYGLHISQNALITCAVFQESGNHISFIDGADGGYALAAKAMKERLKHNLQVSSS